MRVIIAGGRDYRMDALDWRRLDALHAADPEHLGCHGAPLGPITVVYEGEAKGADIGGREWARSRRIPFVPFPANWTLHGKTAGPIRNAEMLDGCMPGMGAAELVAVFPGGSGTADMVEQAQMREVPVLDLRAPRAQRWGADHIADLNSIASRAIVGTPEQSVDAARRAALRSTALAHGGLGVPCCSAHLFRVPGKDAITLPPGALYVGRAGMKGARNMTLPADGDGSILGNPIAYPGGLEDEDQIAAAMDAYRMHLRDLYRADEKVRRLLDRVANEPTLLVCWCHPSKPCHATVIAEAALVARATLQTRAAGLALPPKDLPITPRKKKEPEERSIPAGERLLFDQPNLRL